MAYFIMLVGIPGSGKSTLAHSLAATYKANIHASDAIRRELYGNESMQNDHALVFDTLHKRVKEDLAQGQSTIYDATNISYKRRMAFLQEVKQYNPYTICYVVIKSFEGCISANNSRERIVPFQSIKNMIKSFWVPQYYEGWDDIQLMYTEDAPPLSLDEVLHSIQDFDQQSRWYSLSLGQHLTKTQSLIYRDNNIDLHTSQQDQYLHIAALYHDIGKPFVKSFINKKGEPTNDAHYYGHANVSAYQYLTMSRNNGLSQSAILDICNYIQWHMQPYFLHHQSSENKFIRLVGMETYKRLLLLNTADKNAH